MSEEVTRMWREELGMMKGAVTALAFGFTLSPTDDTWVKFDIMSFTEKLDSLVVIVGNVDNGHLEYAIYAIPKMKEEVYEKLGNRKVLSKLEGIIAPLLKSKRWSIDDIAIRIYEYVKSLA